MKNKISIFLLAVIGIIMAGASANAQNVTLFSANGGIKKVSYSINWKSSKTDSTVEIMVGYFPTQDTSAFYPIYGYTRIGNDTVQSINDSIIDAKSLGGLPRGLICIQARIKIQNITYKSNSICNILIADSLMKPRISWVTNPSIDSAGRVTATIKVETGGLSTIVSTFGTSDSTKVYNTFNGSELFKKNTYTVLDNKPFTVSFGTIPSQTTIACGIKTSSLGGRDSITPMRSGYYVVSQPATGEITNLSEQSDKITVETNIVGFSLQSYQYIKYWKDGTTNYKYTDTVSFTGDSIQKSTKVILGLDTNTLYWFQPYTANSKGGNWGVKLSKKTSKVTPNAFTLTIKKCINSNYTTGETILDYTLMPNTTAVVWQEWSSDQNFNISQGTPPNIQITNVSGEISINTDFRQNGIVYTRIKGTDSRGTQFTSNVMTIQLGSWTTGILENSNSKEFGIYPNPVNDILHISSDLNYEIFNSQGKSVLIGNSNNNQIDMSNYPTGFYFIKIGDNIMKLQKK